MFAIIMVFSPSLTVFFFLITLLFLLPKLPGRSPVWMVKHPERNHKETQTSKPNRSSHARTVGWWLRSGITRLWREFYFWTIDDWE